jgi:hypothetical protein
MPFMSIRLLNASQVRETIIHTALDDLESFLWLLIWGIVYASNIEGDKTANPGIQRMLVVWSGDVILICPNSRPLRSVGRTLCLGISSGNGWIHSYKRVK